MRARVEWVSCLVAAIVGCGSVDASTDPDVDEAAASSALEIGAWVPRGIRARGRIRLSVAVEPRSSVKLSWTDHYGIREGRPRPRATLDVRVLDGRRRTIVSTSHNSEKNANGLEHDPVSFVAPEDGRLLVELEEIDGYGDTVDVRVDVLPTEKQPPRGLVVHEAGSATDATVTGLTGGVLLAGGGRDVDDAMRVAIEAAGKGDAVVLRMDDTGGGYAEYLVGLGAHSATEIVFDPERGNDSVEGNELSRLRALANDPWVAGRIARAELAFFAGGNQTKYVDVFQGTKVAAEIDALTRARRGVVGGTSAGMHVLGGVVHTPRGRGSSVLSTTALEDPYIEQDEHEGTASLSFSRSPFAVPGLETYVFDTHFAQRQRLGRAVTFLARTVKDGWVDVARARLLACDEGTAVFLGDGTPRVFGAGNATLLSAKAAPGRCVDDTPLEWQTVDVVRTRAGHVGPLEAGSRAKVSVANGRLVESP
jgi:cyanophycinase